MKRDKKEIDTTSLHAPVKIQEDWSIEHDPSQKDCKDEKERLKAVNSTKEAERCWIIGEIEAAAARNADYLQVKYKVNGIVCKCIVDIGKWKRDSIKKRLVTVMAIMNVWDFECFVKDEGSIELIYKE